MYELELEKRLIFENNDFIIVQKKSGESFHNDVSGGVGFFNALQDRLGVKLYSVHRLDKATSGLMLMAKNARAQSSLSKLFRDNKIFKQYIAISLSKPKKKQGIVKGDLESSRGGNYKLTRTQDNPSITRFKSFKGEGEYFFNLYPKTGKTHQLRVIAKSLGSPILGDVRYSNDQAQRMYLHAYKLSFRLDNQEHEFICSPNDEKFNVYESYFSEEMK